MAMQFDDDSFLWPDWVGPWRYADVISLRDAACVLTDTDPHKFQRNRVLPSNAETMLDVLRQAAVMRRLPVFAAWVYDDGGFNELMPAAADALTPHTFLADSTTVKIADLAQWCDAKRIPHLWLDPATRQTEPTATGYPDELRAAIEAFNAVHGDPSATAKRSPKAALTAWLEANRPGLSANARERIATVANWQPTGGAPATPG
jgi:hypothetical protein